MSYLTSLATLAPAIEAAGGKTVIITAESEEFLPNVRSKTNYTGENISDPENLIASDLEKKDIVHVAITRRKGYEHGLAQPAIAVIGSDGTVLETWAIKPSVVSLILSLGPDGDSRIYRRWVCTWSR